MCVCVEWTWSVYYTGISAYQFSSYYASAHTHARTHARTHAHRHTHTQVHVHTHRCMHILIPSGDCKLTGLKVDIANILKFFLCHICRSEKSLWFTLRLNEGVRKLCSPVLMNWTKDKGPVKQKHKLFHTTMFISHHYVQSTYPKEALPLVIQVTSALQH